MTIPVELLIWTLGMLGVFLSLCVHLLIRISAKQGDLSQQFAVHSNSVKEKLESLEKDKDRNERELAWMRRHFPSMPFQEQQR